MNYKNIFKNTKAGQAPTNESVQIMRDYLESEDGQTVLENYWFQKYSSEHAEQVGTILENEDLIQKQEETLSKLKRAISEKQLELERQSTTEAYLKRNSLESTKNKLKSLNERGEPFIANELTGVEDLALKTYVKNTRNYEYVVERMAKGSTFGQALQEANIDKYSIDLILRGVDTLQKGNSLTSIRSSHLY